MLSTPLRYAFGGLVALTVAIQIPPLRVDNPPVVQEPEWDSPRTRELAERACFDCHSNQTKLPLYGKIAPVSWFLWDHVSEGRAKLNISEMQRSWPEAHEAGEEVMEGEMPPKSYLLMHPEARLSDEERRALAAGLDATLGGEGGEGGERAEGGEHARRDDDDDEVDERYEDD
ncbi:MAG: heme-binding domain-containing protein [Alphaproteobacteria bacterium]|nr:heme-binding domain-containing protein [Alphaproteobacteria bacterium]